jgi:hypothetical protein
MAMGPEADALRLRRALRDLVALSAAPAAWVGREPPAIAAGLADVLVNSLYLDFAFVRLCDPNGGTAVEITRGNGWGEFPEWLQQYLAVNGRLAGREIVRDIDGGAPGGRGIVVPIGIDAEGGLVAAACDRAEFPTEIDQLLLSVAANHAATAFRTARLSTPTAAPRKRSASASNSFVEPATNSRRRWRNGPPNCNAAKPIWPKPRG